MSEPNLESRERLVAGAADMIRRRGLHSTSIREVAKHAQAPLGSTYHYFPGGKQQLAGEAVRWAGDRVSGMLRERLAAGPVAGLRAFLGLWRTIVQDSDFQAGCPVLAVSIEDSAGPERAIAGEVFTEWKSLLEDSLTRHGVSEARELATLIVASVEGAVAMCRAERSAIPLDHVTAQLERLLTAAVADQKA
ncbi:AcrR family transcriptional regulator [Kibdelosporangium banguiense]|uniref:AcrR family transcriptional regulator n=1 Tax=Kibdelosporangium banguiense TaxID=1365924 RepID=A0ABS4TNT7_9PSEU|nr:TetR/AcrR family transcriptional regulator [Kibdelosporangium banguiense]MBP2326071.1 AcrR family transcriptional regulator [Kibdelosporangium banguiense]